MHNINELVTVIIRTIGERTTGLCYEFIKKQIAEENIHIISETPFTEAVRKTFEVGLRENRKWTFVIDADVIIRPGVISEIVEYAEIVNGKIFELEGKIIDKFIFSLNPREAGNHLYRTKYMNEAIKLIPDPFDEIRPETYVKDAMKRNGYPWLIIDLLIGYHDYEQFYKDIYRKCFIQAKKHTEYGKQLIPQWEKMAEYDSDFKIAIAAFEEGLKWSGEISIDKNSSFLKNITIAMKIIGINEKFEILRSYNNYYNVMCNMLLLNSFFYSYLKQNIKGVEKYFYFSSRNKDYLAGLTNSNPDCNFIYLENISLTKNYFKEKNDSVILDIQIDKYDTNLLNSIYEIICYSNDIRLIITLAWDLSSQDLMSLITRLINIELDVYCFNNNKTVFRLEKLVPEHELKNNENRILYCTKKESSFSLIYFLHSGCGSGAEMSVLDTIKNLISKYGVVANVVMPQRGVMENKFLDVGVPVRIIKYGWWTCDTDIFYFYKSFRNIISKLNELNFINSHLIYTQTIVIPWGAVISIFLERPHIWNIREFGELDHKITFIISLDRILHYINQFSNYITTCGKTVKKILFKDVDEEKLGVAYSNITINLKHQNKILKNSNLEIILPGNIVPSKGQLEAVKAIDVLVNYRGFNAVHLTIIGSGDERYKKKIIDFIRHNNLYQYVTLKDFDVDIHSKILISDIVLSCSTMEAFGRLPLEGLLMRKPVIASNKGGNTEIVFDNRNGFLYEQGNVIDLADKIEYFINNPGDIERMGNAGPEIVKEIISDNYAEDVLYRASMRFKNKKLDYDKSSLIQFIREFLNIKKFIQQTLFIDSGSGFNSAEYLMKTTVVDDKQYFSVEYDLSDYNNIYSLRFDPFEGRCCVLKISHIIIKYSNGEKLFDFSELKNILTCNGEINDTGEVVFYTTDPQLILPFGGEIKKISIEGELRIIGFDQVIQHKDQVIQHKDQVIQHKDQVISSIQKSYAMRLGKMITCLPRKFHNVIIKPFNKAVFRHNDNN